VTGLSATALVEVLGGTSATIGLALLGAGVLIRCFYVRWHKTKAIHVLDGGGHYLRWHTRRDLHEEPWPHPPTCAPAPGAEVTIYYHARRPEQWTLIAPYRSIWWLLGAGALLTGIAVLLPLAWG
jgi:hypothetical protein